MSKNFFSYSYLYALIIFIGFFDAYSYYFCFGIDISSFMTTGEILTSFFPKMLFVLPIIGVFFYIGVINDRSKRKVTNNPPKGIMLRLKRLKFLFLAPKKKLKDVLRILNLINILCTIIIMWLGFLLYPISIGWYLFYTEIPFQAHFFGSNMATVFLFFTTFLCLYYLDNEELFSYLITYGVIITCLAFIGLSNREKATSIVSGEPTHVVSYSIDSKKISTTPSYLFIGMTENYLFFRNTNDGSNSIVKIEDIQDFKMKKIQKQD